MSKVGNLASKQNNPQPSNEINMAALAAGNNINGLSDIKVNDNQFRQDLSSGVLPRSPNQKSIWGNYTYDKESKEIEPFGKGEFEPPPRRGTPSMFNRYALFVHPSCDVNNNIDMLYDIDGNQAYKKENRKLTLRKLLEEFDPDNVQGKGFVEPYYANDFLYLKYFRKIPLNHIITVRRYPYPTYDNLTFPGGRKFRPVAQAVTYFGAPSENDLEKILSFSGFINWKSLEADINNVDGNEQGLENTPGISTGGVTFLAASVINYAAGNQGDLSQRRKREIQHAKDYGDVNYTNKVLGPVNVVTKTKIRDRGIGSEQKYSIVFEYRLNSIAGVNPRIAMLDLLFNMLALSFNNAKFWGGANRYFPASPQFAFFGDQDAFYQGRYGDYGASVMDTIKGGLGNIGSALQDVISGILSGDFSALKKMAGGLAGKALDYRSAKTRPQLLGFKQLLSGESVGEWHMVIGNPLQPIAKIGNLVCTGFSFNFGGFLGADDFPTELKFTIELEDGRPRDKGDIESIFTGNGRGYYPPKGLLDVLNQTSATRADSPNSKGGQKSLEEQKKNFGIVY
jgi:hypothetical protein